MTKDEALETLKYTRAGLYCAVDGNPTVYADALEMAIKALEQTKWIPCSERLPEKDGRYLVTCSKIGSWEVDWNIWHNEPKPSWLWEQGITAWMPLPEPYRGEEDEA